MKRFFYFCAVLTVLVLVLGCGGGKKGHGTATDNDATDTDAATDTDEPGNDSQDTAPDQETDDTDSGDSGPDGDTGDPEIPETTENHKISGLYQIGSDVSGVEAALYECGTTDKIASANTGAEGKYSFKADISAARTYCVKANGFASCFKGMSDHTANISEITDAAYLLDKNCADIRKSETKIRNYAKLGTGEWLGELDYSKLSGISQGLRLLASFLDTTDPKTLSEKIASDVQKAEGGDFGKFFNGFKISADKKEVIINTSNPESSDNEVTLNIEGGSNVVAAGFKIVWTVLNQTAETAAHKFRSVDPGEYTVRARLSAGGDPIMISEDSSTILFMLEKLSGTIDVTDMTKDVSHYIDNGIYVVIPKNTDIKKNGNKVNTITYKILTTGDGSQVSKIDFGPDGTTFTNDSLYFVYELGTVFGGDPIMLSARMSSSGGGNEVLQSTGGNPAMLEAGGDPIMFSAGGDPIMQIARSAGGSSAMISAGGDPIMISDGSDSVGAAAGGDPIMVPADETGFTSVAAGDPIMMGTSSSVMVAKTGHFSGFMLNSASLPVSAADLISKWCGDYYYQGYSPLKFVRLGIEKYKPEGEDKSDLLSYLDCSKLSALEGDLDELFNRQVGFQRNINLFENIYFVSDFYNKTAAKRANGEYVAAKNGLELRSAISNLFISTDAYNRSSTLADMFSASNISMTYSGVTPADYSADAQKAITGQDETDSRYVLTKKEVMIFANYITTSSKGPDFSGVSAALAPDKFICAWFSPDTAAQNCNKVYTLNENGRVALDGTEITLEEAEKIFAKFFMPMNSRLTEAEKLDLFRTYYLVLKYVGTIFGNSQKVTELNDRLLETAYLFFDGINKNKNAVSIVDTFDASAHTVSVLEDGELVTKPYLSRLSSLTGKISLDVATPADVEKVLIKIEGYGHEKVSENGSIYYKPKGELREKSIVLAPGNLAAGLKPLNDILDGNNVDELGDITGKMTVVVNSKISGKTYSTQKTYGFLVNGTNEGVESKPIPSNLTVYLYDSESHPIPSAKNPGIIMNPGNRVLYPDGDGVIRIENLAPASYTINAFADGYYTKTTSVNVPENTTFGVEIRLDEEVNSSSEATLTVKVRINTAKHPDKVYLQIYDEETLLVAKATAVFGEDGYGDVAIDLNFGRYTLLAVGEEMYNYIEDIAVNKAETVKEITVVAKNACGNGIVDSAEECEVIGSDITAVRCGDIYPTSSNPENTTSCDPATCRYDSAICGKASICGDGVIDTGEICDTKSRNCSDIESMGSSAKGIAPCDNCARWVTEGNCTRTVAECAAPLENTVWNDGAGTFEQTWDGTKWMPQTKQSSYGTTRGECVFSCKKGYKWTDGSCVENPLSLGNICTGETGCFDNGEEIVCPGYGALFFGQDSQYAEAGFCTPKSFSQTIIGGSQVIVDDFTHLKWQKTASTSAMDWSDANDYCSHLNDTVSVSGVMWRLPDPAELLTIVNADDAYPALVGGFTANGAHTFWSVEDAGNSENAWMLGADGKIASVEKSAENFVLCVSKNQYDAAANNRFETAAETVTDKESSLMWQRQYASSRLWAEALSYCEEVSTDDKFDWRLPNRNELASIIDFEKSDGAASSLPGLPEHAFWTSTTAADNFSEAWTVDFATGSVGSAAKSETKYVICVRNTGECFGEGCANPCSLDPCLNIKHSNHICTASEGGTFSCGCKSGFVWNNSRCELELTRTRNCDDDSLPTHASWNEYSSITQTCDDDAESDDCWYPSLIGQYNETKNPKECRFVCHTDKGYVWNGDDCVGKMQPVECGSVNSLPENAQWHYDHIVQQWVCNDTETSCGWNIGTEAAYSENPVDNRCRFKCNEHYTWHGETCDADTQPAECDGLIPNATWWNTSITQTWNGSDWAPSKTGTYSKTSVENECVFRCNDGFFWNGSACVSPCTGATNPCSTDTHSTGTCTATSIADYKCECSDGYYWWDDQGCIDKKPLSLGNICTITEGCYNNQQNIPCPEEGEDFYGQSSQYAAKGICAARNLSVNNSVENEPTVFDNNTGLEWQKNIPAAFNSLETALEYCENLEYGGHRDWRLPTHYEMMAAFDYSKKNLVDELYYGENYYWTSSFVSDKNEDPIWSTSEDGALVWSSGHKKWLPSNYTHYIEYDIPEYKLAFCVRGNELPASEFIVSEINGDEVVKDNTTGLMWQKGYVTKTWQNALSYCENLDYAGFTDWRLPNTNELASNDDVYNPTPIFEWGKNLWSADTIPYWESQAYYWNLSILIPAFDSTYKVNGGYQYTAAVRCVRSALCGDDKFWNGSECINPCTAEMCGGGVQASCVPTSYQDHVCKCADSRFFWDGSTCVDPCAADPCADIPHSTHICTSTDWNKYSCGCDEGYFWDSTQCVPITLGRVCTGKNMCSDNSGGIACPSQGEDFFGQDWQYAKEGFCAPRNFRAETVEGDPVIIDGTLGLEWQQPPYSMEADQLDWYDAVDYCNNLTYAGHDDWRLPSVKEFFSLKYNPIDWELGHGRGLWTSQERGEDYAIVVFDNYYDSYYQLSMPGKDDLYAVRCVRGNTIPDADMHSSTVTSGGSSYSIVTDSTTRLIWQKNPEDSTKTWKNALSYCENLEYAGLSNWRLPNNNELMSLINNNGSSNFPQISEATASDSREFWTSSSLYETSGSAFVLYSYGSGNFKSKTGKSNVVCVHSDICKEGEFWNGSACVNPCEPNPCAALANSTHECTATAWNNYECECNDGYAWNGALCVPQTFGRICTGQDKCYNNSEEISCPAEGEDFFGQDAQYTTKCTAQSFSADEWVVIDNNTGLTWEKSPSEETYTWDNRATHCNDLNNSNYGSRSNWRVPNPLELLTIVNNSTYNPATNSNFSGMPISDSTYLWTNNEYKGDTSYAYYFTPSYGWYWTEEKTYTYKVLCVSGEEMKPAVSSDFTTSSDGKTVTDNRTGLMWQNNYPSSTTYTWVNALKYCEDLSYAGYTDWRLANKNELASLVNYEKSASPYSYFPNMPGNWFWSSSTRVGNTNRASGVDFYYGAVNTGNKANDYYVRCVR
ncbi:DUF1566 domain-containing protein [bacterium]|nr:DUF1566 domain-containing protein [bacterium]